MPQIIAAAAAVVLLVGSVVLLWPGGTSGPVVQVLETSATSVELKWKRDPEAEGYTVSIATDPAMKSQKTEKVQKASTTVTGLEQGTRYWIKVSKIDPSNGTEPLDGDHTVTARTEAVPAPLWAGEPRVDTREASLDWSDIAKAQAYVVEVASDEAFSKPKQTVVNASDATINKLQSGGSYWFRVAVSDADGKAIGPWSEAISAETVEVAVKVGTFNISGVHNDKHGDVPLWRNRRPEVINDITQADLDVVGIQEVSTVDGRLYARNLVNGNTQLADLVNGLKSSGGRWAASSMARDTSNDTRILYRSDRLDLVSQGGMRYSSQVSENKRYLAWAVFKVKETGREFLFVTTHLTPRSSSVRERQWRQLISVVNSKAGKRPVIIGGDFNASKFKQPGGRMLTVMENAGFGDVLGQRYRDPSPSRSRAEKMIDTNFGSYNDYKRSVKSYGTGRIGNSVDYIFASNDLPVREFRMVVDRDSSGRLAGTIASDHFLLAATIELTPR